ncbi:MAG: TRAP transporter small permease subunit [Rhodobacteraceae bacterium]|nr:TRAP transporter small permease subunit [Paracoccaceae bacterium]MCY4195508.1 TRAP transporter small permease subunit [Paracoccaceae bacterium]MCY4326188.1 TRAP transporter small permease subunit [Paracoccaceae bacterium]
MSRSQNRHHARSERSAHKIVRGGGRLLSRVNACFATIGGWLLLLTAIMLTVDVTFRNLFEPLQMIPLLSVFALIAVTYFGLSATEEIDGHVSLKFLVTRLTSPFRHIVNVLTVMGSGLLAVALITNAVDSFITGEGSEGALTFKLWPIKFAMVVGAALFFAETCRKMMTRQPSA